MFWRLTFGGFRIRAASLPSSAVCVPGHGMLPLEVAGPGSRTIRSDIQALGQRQELTASFRSPIRI